MLEGRMNLAELKKCIVEKQFDNVYIFTGDEIKIMNIYIKQIADLQNRAVVRRDTVGEIFKTLKVSRLTKDSNVYVILDDMDFIKQEKYWEQLMTATKDHTIILVYSQMDKRGKFYKQYKDKVCEFEKLHESVLAKYIQKEVHLNTDRAKELSLMCDNSYNRILMEVDKLKHLLELNRYSTEEDILDLMIEQGLIYTTKTDIVFQVVDAICKRDVETTLELLSHLDVVKDSPIAVLSLLYTNIKSMLLVRVCPQGAKISDTTGLTGWQIKMAYEKGYNYEPEELLGIMEVIKYIDEAIKIGRIEPQYALPYLITQVM
jgi:DNA polymerase III delta subunit